jgi:hypothetical protein
MVCLKDGLLLWEDLLFLRMRLKQPRSSVRARFGGGREGQSEQSQNQEVGSDMKLPDGFTSHLNVHFRVSYSLRKETSYL